MKKVISIFIIILILFSFVYSENNVTNFPKKGNEKQYYMEKIVYNESQKYWSKSVVYIKKWKSLKDRARIRYVFWNKEGNIQIRSYKINFCFVYEDGTEEFYKCEFIAPLYLAQNKKRKGIYEAPKLADKEIVDIYIKDLEFKLVSDDTKVGIIIMNVSLIILIVSMQLNYIKAIADAGYL
ncbi:hypothetical protein KAU33_00855 [Candidatus Dependentiae bacterium]|nr:hypothetical protein [Candidatus Dependentiae bacterium]